MELLHHRLGHRSTRSLLDWDSANFWQYIQLMVDPDTLYTLCKLSTINRKSRSNTSLKSKTPFKQVLMDIIPATTSKSLTKYTTFDNYPLIVDTYSNIKKLHGM